MITEKQEVRMSNYYYLIEKARADIAKLWYANFKYALIIGCICGLLYLIFMILQRKPKWRAVPAFFLGMYSYYIYAATVMTREPGSRTDINLVLFSTLTGYCPWFALENLFMLLPMGVLLPMVFRPAKKWWFGPFAGFLLAFCIETLQHITQTGHFELDDILFNGTGQLIGWILYKILERIHHVFIKK